MSSEVKIDEQQIREYAHQIWLSEGCPEGQAQRHWEMARQLAEAEALAARRPAALRAQGQNHGDRGEKSVGHRQGLHLK